MWPGNSAPLFKEAAHSAFSEVKLVTPALTWQKLLQRLI